MWCAACHSFWDWETELTYYSHAAPHNPDHREWMARTSNLVRETEDVPCGGIPDRYALHRALPRNCHPALVSGLWPCSRPSGAARRLRRRYARAVAERAVGQHLRIPFLLGEMDRTAFERRLERKLWESEFFTDLRQVMELHVFCGIYLLVNLLSSGDLMQTLAEAEELRKVVDGRLETIGAMHDRKPPRLEERWRWTLPYSRRS